MILWLKWKIMSINFKNRNIQILSFIFVFFFITLFLHLKWTQYQSEHELNNYLRSKIIHKNLEQELALNLDTYKINPILTACVNSKETRLKSQEKLLILGKLKFKKLIIRV